MAVSLWPSEAGQKKALQNSDQSPEKTIVRLSPHRRAEADRPSDTGKFGGWRGNISAPVTRGSAAPMCPRAGYRCLLIGRR